MPARLLLRAQLVSPQGIEFGGTITLTRLVRKCTLKLYRGDTVLPPFPPLFLTLFPAGFS